MKKIILTLSIINFYVNLFAQNVNGVSTNPLNPINPVFLPWANQFLGSGITYDPFLNAFDWGPNVLGSTTVTDKIPFISNQFNTGGIGAVTKLNPFNTGMLGSSSSYMNSVAKSGIDVKDRDFRWEDGWELLWLNLGLTPDLVPTDVSVAGSAFQTTTPPAPEQMPYFVLYNRYKGTMRIFANAFFNRTTFGNPQKVIPRLFFSDKDILNGMLRHAAAYDQALDQKTIIDNISGPSFQTTNPGQWLMADFQIGFDPCICNRNNALLKFEFNQITKMDISMVSRSISLTKSIDDNSYLDSSFMNLNDVDNKTKPYKPGTRIYGEMKGLLDGYKNSLAQYEKDLANYNSIDNILKRAAIDILKDGITSTGSMVGAGVAGSFFTNSPMKNFILKNKLRVGLFSGGLIDLDTNNANAFANSVTDGTKSILGQGFDFLNTIIDVPGEPIKPSPPTATFTETSYKGSIDYINPVATDGLIVPGAIPFGYPDNLGNPTNPGVNKLNYPAYNEVLGLFALLETPKIEISAKNINSTRAFNKVSIQAYRLNVMSQKTNYQIRLKEPLKYRFNHVVNFNFSKTKLYYSFRIKFKNRRPTLNGLDPSIYGTSALSNAQMISNQTILETDVNNVETFGTGNENRFVIITTPFTEVKSILNEPLNINNILDMTLLLNVDIFRVKDPNKFASILNLSLTNYSNIESIDLKLMADMYFLSPGSKGQEINTLQTFTYKIYENSGNDNQTPDELNSTIGNVTFLKQNESILKHQPGNVVFDNIQLAPATITAYTHYTINATEMHIYVENAILKNNITVAPGYKAYIHFLGEALSEPETEMFPELVIEHMKSEDLYQNALIYEATNEEVTNFCSLNNNKYQANTSLSKSTPLVEKPKEEQEPKDTYIIYPNPASGGEFNILLSVKENTNVTITLFDLTGKQVAEICNKQMEKGNHQAVFNTENLSAGVYFCKLTTGYGETKTQKLVITK
jgi:hypothetical protein